MADNITLVPAQTAVELIETAVGFILLKVKGTTKLQVPSVTLAYKVCEPVGMVLFAVKIVEAKLPAEVVAPGLVKIPLTV